jgi:hypothetical protein
MILCFAQLGVKDNRRILLCKKGAAATQTCVQKPAGSALMKIV